LARWQSRRQSDDSPDISSEGSPSYGDADPEFEEAMAASEEAMAASSRILEDMAPERIKGFADDFSARTARQSFY